MSTPPLFWLDPLPDGERVLLTGDEGRHAARVRRITPGEAVTLGDGRGHLLDTTVTAVRPDGLVLHVTARRDVPAPEPRLVAVQALSKGDRAELAVEMMTELGVDEIVPWAAEHSVVQWRGERGAKALARWRRTAREAAKQSRRAWVPLVGEPVSTAALAARLETSGTLGLVLHESATDPLTATPPGAVGELILVVGPEGGISPSELDRLTATGARAVRLGGAVLRTSTAGAAALSVLSARLDRWG